MRKTAPKGLNIENNKNPIGLWFKIATFVHLIEKLRFKQ